MNQRSANRRREHAAHGWKPDAGTTMTASTLGRAGQVFMRCPCGWFGWVDEQAAVPAG